MDAETPWATYGTDSHPLVVEYGAATGPFRATGLDALKGSGYAALSSGRTRAFSAHAVKRLRTTPPAALKLSRSAGRSPRCHGDGGHHGADKSSAEQLQRPPHQDHRPDFAQRSPASRGCQLCTRFRGRWYCPPRRGSGQGVGKAAGLHTHTLSVGAPDRYVPALLI